MNAVATPTVSIEALESASVDAESFNHGSHVYADAIRRLTIKLGAETKYHETITCFFMQLISQRRIAMQQRSWVVFRCDNTDLIENAGITLNRYYSKELLASDIARQQFLLPDKLLESTS